MDDGRLWHQPTIHGTGQLRHAHQPAYDNRYAHRRDSNRQPGNADQRSQNNRHRTGWRYADRRCRDCPA